MRIGTPIALFQTMKPNLSNKAKGEKTMKKLYIMLGLLLVAGFSQQVFADSVQITTPDGTFNVSQLDWQVGNAVSIGSLPSAVGETSQFYMQAYLGGMLDGTGNPITALDNLNQTYEITAMVASLEQVTVQAGSYIELHTVPGGVNYLQIFIDYSPDANMYTGTGFNDGILLFSGTVDPYNILTGDGITTFTNTSPVPGNLDQYNANDYPGVGTLVGTGATTIESPIFYHDPSLVNIYGSLMLSFNSQPTNSLAFSQTNPSQQFLDLSTNTFVIPSFWPDGAAVTPYAYMNGGPRPGVDCGGAGLPDCPPLGTYDFQFQADASTSVEVEGQVPEPSTLILFGAGLLAMAAINRKRTRG